MCVSRWKPRNSYWWERVCVRVCAHLYECAVRVGRWERNSYWWERLLRDCVRSVLRFFHAVATLLQACGFESAFVCDSERASERVIWL